MVESKKTKLNLWQKIAKVMEGIEYLKKDDTISYGKTNYKAMSEEKVTKEVRALFIKYGLVIIPFEQEVTSRDIIKNQNGLDILVGFLTQVNTKYKLIDIDTGTFETVASSGQGVDSQDKGVGKAMTYAFKYALLRSLAIPTGEDPDKISSEEITDAQQKELDKTAEATKKEVRPPANVPIRGNTATEVHLLKTFPGTKVEGYDKNKQTPATLADDPEVMVMSDRLLEKGVKKMIVDALVRSYTVENKATLLRIMETKL